MSETAEKYRVWLLPDGKVRLELKNEYSISETVLYAAYDHQAGLDDEQIDLPNGLMVHVPDSKDPINMAAAGLAKEKELVIRGSVLFAIRDEDGQLNSWLDQKTADWIRIWASDRCTVCGKGSLTLNQTAFPISNGKCCERCAKVVESVRSYMGIRYTLKGGRAQ